MDRSIMEKAKNTKEENLKSKESENCLHIQKYLEIIPKISHVVEGKWPGLIEPLIFYWVNNGWDTLISIPRYSDSVSWWSQNNKKMAVPP